jgi:hypothetical protein
MLGFGAAYGGFNSLLGPVAIAASGRAHIGLAIGILSTSRALGILFGPWLVGLAAWSTGSYGVPFIGCTCVAVAAALLLSGLAGRSTLTPAAREAHGPRRHRASEVAGATTRRGATGAAGIALRSTAGIASLISLSTALASSL